MTSTTFFAVTPTTSPEAMALLQTLIANGALQPVVPAAGAPPTPTTPLATAEDVIAAIPVAEDGEVIRSTYHNALRDALIALLAEVGVGRGPIAPLAPAFAPTAGKVAWDLLPGVARKPAVTSPAKASAEGWMPVELPHGGRIKQLVVTGQRSGSMDQFKVILFRQEISSDATPPTNTIASVDLKNSAASFLESTDAGAEELTDPTPAQVLDYTTVDNTKYKYFIQAKLMNAVASGKAQINSLQVVITRV
jgi:hypothetical protein